jgi:hypothetical protein
LAVVAILGPSLASADDMVLVSLGESGIYTMLHSVGACATISAFVLEIDSEFVNSLARSPDLAHAKTPGEELLVWRMGGRVNAA